MEIFLKVKSFSENEQVILASEQGEEISWPKSKLPENIYEDEILSFKIMTKAEAEKEKSKQAKDILNEILDTK